MDDRMEERINFAQLGVCWLYDKLNCIDRKLDTLIAAQGDSEALEAARQKLNQRTDAVGAALASADKPQGS